MVSAGELRQVVLDLAATSMRIDLEDWNKISNTILGAANTIERLRETLRVEIEGSMHAWEERMKFYDENKRLREALKKLSCNCDAICDWDFDGEVCPSWEARAALKGDE